MESKKEAKVREITLSEKDEAFRNFSLTGNMWWVIFSVCTPLALYQSLNQIFKILDSMMASHISAESVSAVAYLSQINLMLSAIGGGLAIGGSLKISQAYGLGDYKLVRERVNGLYGICAILGLGVLLFIAPFTTGFLKLANTPNELIEIGRTYFIVELIGMVISFFNNVYIAIERSRGNSKRILKLNMASIIIKLLLTAFFVYVLRSGITMIAVATVISNSIIFIASIVNLVGKDDAFGVNFKSMGIKKNVTIPMLHISFPVITEKVAFAFGKVIINSMSTMYGVLTVGALGISNNIGGMTTNPQNGFQEGGAAIISQNLGANMPERALDSFKKVVIINIGIGILGMGITMGFLGYISKIFGGDNKEFCDLISRVYYYEAWGLIPLGINSAVMSLLYGFGYTKITLLINFSRVFIFRVPVLWALQRFTNIGSKSVGIVMLISNSLVGIMAVIVSIIVIRNICKEYQIKFFDK
jgi:putative MATE family efflux protein